MAQVFERDEDGNVLNPPNNPTYERELTRARDTGDDSVVQRVQREYDKWREDEVKEVESQADGDVTVASDASNAGPTPGAEPDAPDAPDAPASDPAPGNDNGGVQ